MFTTNLIAAVFDRKIEAEAPLSTEAERALIEAARAGDGDAYSRLLIAYGPALRASVSSAAAGARHRGDNPDYDELRSLALTGFVEAIHAVKGDRLAGVIKGHLLDAVIAAAPDAAPVTVPDRTLRRYYAVLRAAKGDPVLAESLAPEHDMSVEAFRRIRSAIRDGVSLDAMADAGLDPASDRDSYASVEDVLLAGIALDACNDDERVVAEYAYGFRSYNEPLIDAEVAERAGTSRSRVQRLRMSGLEAMRARLGA